jgi:hypothetical protein
VQQKSVVSATPLLSVVQGSSATRVEPPGGVSVPARVRSRAWASVYEPRDENRSHGSALGAKLHAFLQRDAFRYVFGS